MAQLMYDAGAAAGYERAFARVSSHFIPFLLSAGHVASGQRVLDVATGTGLAAEAALAIVGANGHVVAADISPHMAARARERLTGAPNVSVCIEDGQALTFPDETFDTVLCSLGLMFFPDPARGLAEFHRVLRPGGRAAVSVNTVPERSYNTRIHPIIARHAASLAPAASQVFSLGDAARLQALFVDAGFHDVDVTTTIHHFGVPSFKEYFEHVERGWGSAGQVFVSLPEEVKRAVREDVRRDVGDTGGPLQIEVEYRFASGQK
ncbi:methyltransferase domain-containing protein [Mesorhizobium sp. M00.F.Ca.ET.216.01.1.1]|uniref:class I SAM-dependent methyltransferase n=1 Tax=Mesorhizobium sp. M00.F.Ca.ET.216.01.1.1 TaxID=2500528 RepID=UPI000FD99E04|nr:methyltransferase domain-containing protein [Mesorhizobium sp. M00.F.Ca.ET.216.01.1.1]TGQ29027.1 methyltransferase domain-containing protein [Mesorhizobium sp. M00.F.Ca.ET.216.01.1.1]